MSADGVALDDVKRRLDAIRDGAVATATAFLSQCDVSVAPTEAAAASMGAVAAAWERTVDECHAVVEALHGASSLPFRVHWLPAPGSLSALLRRAQESVVELRRMTRHATHQATVAAARLAASAWCTAQRRERRKATTPDERAEARQRLQAELAPTLRVADALAPLLLVRPQEEQQQQQQQLQQQTATQRKAAQRAERARRAARELLRVLLVALAGAHSAAEQLLTALRGVGRSPDAAAAGAAVQAMFADQIERRAALGVAFASGLAARVGDALRSASHASSPSSHHQQPQKRQPPSLAAQAFRTMIRHGIGTTTTDVADAMHGALERALAEQCPLLHRMYADSTAGEMATAALNAAMASMVRDAGAVGAARDCGVTGDYIGAVAAPPWCDRAALERRLVALSATRRLLDAVGVRQRTLLRPPTNVAALQRRVARWRARAALPAAVLTQCDELLLVPLQALVNGGQQRNARTEEEQEDDDKDDDEIDADASLVSLALRVADLANDVWHAWFRSSIPTQALYQQAASVLSPEDSNLRYALHQTLQTLKGMNVSMQALRCGDADCELAAAQRHLPLLCWHVQLGVLAAAAEQTAVARANDVQFALHVDGDDAVLAQAALQRKRRRGSIGSDDDGDDGDGARREPKRRRRQTAHFSASLAQTAERDAVRLRSLQLLAPSGSVVAEFAPTNAPTTATAAEADDGQAAAAAAAEEAPGATAAATYFGDASWQRPVELLASVGDASDERCIGRATGRCQRCGVQLRSVVSQRLGLGPHCAAAVLPRPTDVVGAFASNFYQQHSQLQLPAVSVLASLPPHRRRPPAWLTGGD